MGSLLAGSKHRANTESVISWGQKERVGCNAEIRIYSGE